LAATFMNVQFTIHQSTAAGTIVYQEDHNYTTDANGLLILNIGTDASPSVGVFANIDWSADLHFLQTTITYNGNTIDFDATQFMAVPYAEYATTAQTAQVANNLSGLEKITENGNTGWRMIGASTATRADIGENAIDMSYSGSISSPLTNGATGARSFAIGNRTEASGNESTAMGWGTKASGTFSTAMGSVTTASGNNSTAMGFKTTAPSYLETTIGSYNTDYTPIGTTYWNANDRVFVIGKGFTNATKSDALIVLKDGTITAPSFSISEIDTAGDKALITKEYADTNYLTIESAETNYLSSSGDVSIEGELQQTSTGNANLVPLAYGTVDSNGDTVTGTGNFTAFLSSNVFIIDVNEAESLSYGNTVCLITPISTAPRTASTVISDGNGDGDADLNVRIFNASGTQVLTTFQFVIYKL
jgi:hypothetical protein